MLKLFAALFIALSSLTAQSADLNLKKDNLEIGKFNFETKRVLLNSGYYMPLVGLGTYSLNHDECMLSVGTLLKSGGRLIDTAYMYHNEKSVGQAVRELGVPREEMFVTTKIYQKKISG